MLRVETITQRMGALIVEVPGIHKATLTWCSKNGGAEEVAILTPCDCCCSPDTGRGRGLNRHTYDILEHHGILGPSHGWLLRIDGPYRYGERVRGLLRRTSDA